MTKHYYGRTESKKPARIINWTNYIAKKKNCYWPLPSWIQVSSSPVYNVKYPFLFENRDFSPPVWPTTSRIRWNGHRKRIFFKTLSKVEIFENAGFSFSRGRTKIQRCHTANALRGIKSCFHRFSVFMWTGETIRISYVRTRIFSKRGRKISVFHLTWKIRIRADDAGGLHFSFTGWGWAWEWGKQDQNLTFFI